jgi:hypothetical protein
MNRPADTQLFAMTTPDERSLRAWRFRQLRRSLQALAAPPSGQLALFPEDVAKADELALHFDHWASVIRSSDEGALSDEQRDSLSDIDEKLATMSRDGAEFDADIWTDEALRNSEHWAAVRALAVAALEAFAWASAEAPSDVHDRTVENAAMEDSE